MEQGSAEALERGTPLRDTAGSARSIGHALARSSLAPMVVALVAFLVMAWGAGRPFGQEANPSFLLKLGSQFAGNPTLLPSDAYVFKGTGYDGQFSFYIAQDPLLTGKVANRDHATSAHFDELAYRYQRIMLPALAYVASGGGDPDVLPWVIPLINLLAVLGSGFLLARFLASRGRSPWLSLAYMLSLGTLAGVLNDLTNPLAVSLLVAGVIWWLDGRTVGPVVVFTAALLTRETFLVPVAAICLLELVRRRRHGLPWLIPVGAWAAWQLYLSLALEASVGGQHVARPSPIPIVGSVRKIWDVLHDDIAGAANWEVMMVLALLAMFGLLVVRAVAAVRASFAARRVPSPEEALPIVGVAALALMPFLTNELWRNPLSYTRYAVAGTAVLLLLYAMRSDRAALLIVGVISLLTLVNPVISILPTSYGAMVVPA